MKDVALIGIGYWGKNLARNYYELGVLHTICDLNKARHKEYKNKFLGTNFVSDYQEVLNNPKIKKVVIAVPTKLHFALAEAALLANKDVFVEKAMCNNIEEAQALVALAEKKNRILMVGHLLNYHPAVEHIKELVSSGVLGEIYHISFNRLNFGSVGEETSALWAFAPHDISVLLALAKNKNLQSLSSKNKCFFSENFIDQSWIHFEFEGNLSADIQVGWAFPHPERKFTIMGSKGMLVFDDLKGWNEKVILWKSHVQIDENKINFNSRPGEHIEVEQKEPLKEECRHFLACCEERKVPLTDGREGLKVMEILEQVKSPESELALSFD